MAIKRMDNVGIVVNDLKAAIAFFGELGMELVGETTVMGDWVDRVVGLNGNYKESSTAKISPLVTFRPYFRSGCVGNGVQGCVCGKKL